MRSSAGAVLFLLLLESSALAATTALRPWNEYRTIMWVGSSASRKPEKFSLFFERLRDMGINTAMVHGDGNLQPLLENHFPYYVENMVNRGLCLKFSSNVRDWDKFVTDWARNGRPESALVRGYCFDDPQWRGWARKEMQSLVRKNMGHAPLAYNIRDELSTTISANPFDYDFNPLALAGFREWLKTQYASLTALNAEWQTDFASWDKVKPFTTDEIKNRMASGEAMPRGKPDWQAVQRLKFNPAEAPKQATRWNFAPWCDFRAYMDLSLARTLDDLRGAAHELDAQTPVGIEGTQMPSAFGGYDLWRLSQILDWVEPYDIGNAREILGSFMPEKPILTTVFEKDTGHASRRLWHLLLEGDRGCLVWWSEDCIDWKSSDYALTAKASALAPVLKEMTSPLAQLFLRAERERDPIFLVYSQPSIQVDWLLESTTDGSTWLRRFSSFEADHNRMAKRRNGWLKLFQDLGYSPQFIAADQLTNLPSRAVLVLSDALAVSDQHANAIKALKDPGDTTVFADSPAGLFDEHGRLRAIAPALAGKTAEITAILKAKTESKPGDMAEISRSRLRGTNIQWSEFVARNISLPRAISVAPETHTRVHRFKLGSVRLVAFERNIDYHMSEDLKQAGGNEPLEKPARITATLDQPAHVYDLRGGGYLGRTREISFTLDPWRPSLFALLPSVVNGNVVDALQKEMR